MKKINWHFLYVFSMALFLSAPSAAQDTYPNKPIRLLVAFAAGGGTDVMARNLAQQMTKALGQNVVVENRIGANGIVATTELFRANPDGYTLIYTIPSHITNALLYSNLPYDPVADFTPIYALCTVPFVLSATPGFPANNVKELVALATSQPAGAINYASPGTGSPPHFYQEMMNNILGIKMTHVPYKGSALAMSDLLSGRTQLIFLSTVQSQPYLKDGRLKGIGLSSAKRSSVLPDIPTLDELGVTGLDVDMWYGVLAPKGVPTPIVEKLAGALKTIAASTEMKRYLAEQGAEPLSLGPEEFGGILRNEAKKWGKLIKDADIKAE